MMFDYIIIGFGISGIAMTYQLERQGKKVAVIDGNHIKASTVAAGVYNPVILKRFTMAWNADEQLKYANYFYEDLATFLNIRTTEEMPIYRKFYSAEEQNKWFHKIDSPILSTYLSPYLKREISKGINDDLFQYGEVKLTGRVLISNIIEAYKIKLKKQNAFFNEEIDYAKLKINVNEVSYNEIRASRLVFCEGYNLIKNPFFNYLPLIGNKGSYLIIKCEELKISVAVKSFFFLIPLGNHTYKFGATYQNKFVNIKNEEATKVELITRLDELLNIPYEIIAQVTAVRPTVIDRRPLVGEHKEHKLLYVFNGMGTRGTLLAPTVSKYLVDFMEQNMELPNDINCNRF